MVICARLSTWKDADRVGPAQHVVDRRILRRDARHVERAASVRVCSWHRQRLGDGGEHAEREHVDLQHAEHVEIVLVPFDDGAVLHGRVLDGHHLVEPPAGDDEPADVLGQVPREADEFLGEAHHPLHRGIGGIDAGTRRVLRPEGGGDQPQICPDRAPTASSDRPKALPTSRIADRAR